MSRKSVHIYKERELGELDVGLLVGFCIGGHVSPSRDSQAYVAIFAPSRGMPTPVAIPIGQYAFWGAPNMIQRLIFGYDERLKAAITASGNWTGSSQDLDNLLAQFVLAHPNVPVRDSIDFIYSCIASTIKALKFSHLSQICGGPIEIAVITSDRDFRWVRHKGLDAAIKEGLNDG